MDSTLSYSGADSGDYCSPSDHERSCLLDSRQLPDEEMDDRQNDEPRFESIQETF